MLKSRIDPRKLFLAIVIAAAFVYAKRELASRRERVAAPEAVQATQPTHAPRLSDGARPMDPQAAPPEREALLAQRFGLPKNSALKLMKEERGTDRIYEFYVQTWDGFALEPVGRLTRTRSFEGNELEITQSLKTGLQITNRRKIDPRHAIAGVPNPRAIIYVEGNIGYHAYEGYVQGIRQVIDAESGKTLDYRDERQF